MQYPIGVQSFETIREKNFIYVDKTDMVYELAQQHVCILSRPRRFGKSLLISTLEAYFLGKKELFSGLKMESLESEWTEYPVFRIDFAGGDYNKEEMLKNILESSLRNWEKKYGIDSNDDTIEVRFWEVLKKAEEVTGHKAVVLIDEYDKPMLDVLGTEMEAKNRNTLNGFFGTFKAADAHLRFVFLTGVMKFSPASAFSGFNQAYDISLNSGYEAICGITEDELYHYFDEPIVALAKKMNISVDEAKAILKERYDGYHFSDEMIDIYNPFSIINAFDKNELDDYWHKSSIPTYLAKLLEGHHVNVQKMLDRSYTSDYFADYNADDESPLAMIYQSGYLTIKYYDREYNLYQLDFPNKEVREGFMNLMQVCKESVNA